MEKNKNKIMKNKEITEKFIKFLKSKRAYSKFMKNFKVPFSNKSIEEHIDLCLKGENTFIGSAFKWDKTKEGWIFWGSISNEWETIKDK